jgi:hypothetical protein
MPLSNAEKNANALELTLIHSSLVSIHQHPGASQEIQIIINAIANFVDEEDISINAVPATNERLINIVETTLREIPAKRQQFLMQQLRAWSPEYKELSKRLSVTNRATHAEQPRGIIRSLQIGKMADRVWGEDIDTRIALKSVIKYPEENFEDGIHILPPVSLVAGANATDQEVKEPHLFYENSIRTVVENNNNKDKNLTLLTQVNCGDNHWELAITTLQQGNVTSSTLWDSMASVNKTALNNMQTAINRLIKPENTSPIKVAAQAVGIQKNGMSCWDYTLQKSLQIKYENDDSIDPALNRIRDTRNSSQALREACTDVIIQNHTTLHDEKEELNTIDTTDEKSRDTTLFGLLAKDKLLQVKFDGLMASKLHALYLTATNKDLDSLLVTQARKFAFEKLSSSFGLFKPKSPGALQDSSEEEVKCNKLKN